MSDESDKLLPSNLNEMPSNWWRDESICRFLSHIFGDHIVGLLVAYKTNTHQSYQQYTGFLYEHKGIPFWISAGHVVDAVVEI